MRVCNTHDEVYNEIKGGCPVCDQRISDPLDIMREDVVKVDTGVLTIIERGRVEQVGCPTKHWMIYDLDDSAIKVVSLRCVVTKLDETYETARKY